MRVLSEEKIKVLADRNGWSFAYSHGFVDGETHRRRGTIPSKYAQIGIDDYSLGFRAGFYERGKPGPASSGKPDVPVKARHNASRS